MWEEPYAKIRTYGSVRGVVSNGYAYSICAAEDNQGKRLASCEIGVSCGFLHGF